jgi:DNA topoisomerase-1
MQVAQMLYEGGYITYHRTDSMNLAPEAITEVREYIEKTYGKEFVPSQVKVYKSKNKVVAQEAHEAIRPTGISSQHLEPGEQLNKDQSKLYELIWRRFVGCQMAEAKGVSVKVSVSGKNDDKDYGLEARGEIINFKGWMVLNTNGEVEDEVSDSTELPELSEGENLGFVDVTSEQKFTQPPARYNDASLIKALEEKGIGRPSTYAPTISTIQERQYVEKADKRFNPTALGIAVNDFLVTNFSEILDYDFTANMEDQLDDIAAGERKWQPVVADFYKPFEKSLKKAIETADRVKVEVETTGEKCPKCKDGDVVIRVGRFGKFLACSKFPDCDFKANYVEKINMACPKCSEGEVIVKRTKSRKTFFGCSNYPKCDFASWVKPKIV